MWDWVHNWGIIREIIKRIYGPVPYSARWALRPFNLVNPKIIIRHSINWRYQPQLSFMHSASVDRGPSSLSFFSKKYSVFTSFSLCEWKNEDSFSILYDFLCFVWNDRGNTKRCKIKMLWYLWTRGFQFKQWIPAFSRRFHIFFYLYFFGGGSFARWWLICFNHTEEIDYWICEKALWILSLWRKDFYLVLELKRGMSDESLLYGSLRFISQLHRVEDEDFSVSISKIGFWFFSRLDFLGFFLFPVVFSCGKILAFYWEHHPQLLPWQF